MAEFNYSKFFLQAYIPPELVDDQAAYAAWLDHQREQAKAKAAADGHPLPPGERIQVLYAKFVDNPDPDEPPSQLPCDREEADIASVIITYGAPDVTFVIPG
ncbi:MAG TPA: hypothetical protein VEV61_11225 [Streptosporangiaceae bacterium]|nr:hypothetical protein [Streptosporangiaceae bacterium]